MNEVQWIKWLLDVTQDTIRPAVLGLPDQPEAADSFHSSTDWARADAAFVPPARAWARALPPAELDRYRDKLSRFFREQVPCDNVPKRPPDPRPLSDLDTWMALDGMWNVLEWLRRPRNHLGVFGQWPIRPRVRRAPGTRKKRIDPDVGQLYFGNALHGVPFVRVEHYDRGLRVIEQFARLVAKHWERIRHCDNSECTRTFVAVKRQINCSTRCQNLKSQRAYRGRLNTDAKARARRRAAQKDPYKWRLKRLARRQVGIAH